MKRSGYMTRAMKARDPRFARVLGRLGYERTDMVADDGAVAVRPARDPLDHDNDGRKGGAKKQTGDDLAGLRKEYEAKVGKRPFMGWDAATLTAKITEAEG